MLKSSYYPFQRLLGRTLLVWGIANAVFGALVQLNTNPFLKQFGLQALVWGAIDAVIALFGLRDAARKQTKRADPTTEAGRFRLIVALNALLDVGYVAGGFALLRTAKVKNDRAGMGAGIITQGAFLLLFDLLLTWLSGRWTANGGR